MYVHFNIGSQIPALETEARLDAGYPLRGVISDFAPGFAQIHRDHFGMVPFQACRVHFDRRLDSDIPKAKWSVKAPFYAELRERVRQVLYASTYDDASRHLLELTHDRAFSAPFDSCVSPAQRRFSGAAV
jgi:hypothetical protein